MNFYWMEESSTTNVLAKEVWPGFGERYLHRLSFVISTFFKWSVTLFQITILMKGPMVSQDASATRSGKTSLVTASFNF